MFDSDDGNIGVSLADRPYFLLYRNNPAAGFEISAPVLSRSTGSWFISATRAWRGAGGEFRGVIVAALEPKYLDRVWTTDVLGATFSIALFRVDGVLLMRSPFSDSSMGRSFAESPVFRTMLRQREAGSYRNESVIDGQPRLLAYRRLSAYPALVIIAGRTIEETLSDWRRYVVIAVGGWAAASLALILIALFLRREWKRREFGQARFDAFMDASPFVAWVKDDSGRLVYTNRSWRQTFGTGEGDSAAKNVTPFSPEQAARMSGHDDEVLATGKPGQFIEETTSEAGEYRRWNTIKIPFVDAGKRPLVGGIAIDVTQQYEIEEQLRQAQKIDAVGQMTGGIAHDFNNMLTVIVGNADILHERLAADPQLQAICARVLSAAEGAASLTHRLLAFARRQPLQPQPTDINDKARLMEPLLKPALGENVELKLILQTPLWDAIIDPVQLESAILNLALNGRDAMPGGGRLILETANVTLDAEYTAANREARAGDYVMVAVCDTGTGMTPEVAARAFDPFFTTKDVGKGSGLGLSMVYGFIRQSGGHVKIYSEAGQGTCVKMYLPRATGARAAVVSEPARTLASGGESLLVVEDDPLVRDHVTAQLTGLGYRVAAAANGLEAMELLAGATCFDLMFTDVVMPGGMTGRDLAEKARALHPAMKIVFTSGYTQNAIVHNGRLDPGVHLLSKPYRLHDLAAKIRAVLDARDDSAA